MNGMNGGTKNFPVYAKLCGVHRSARRLSEASTTDESLIPKRNSFGELKNMFEESL